MCNNCQQTQKCNECECGLIPTDRVYYSGEYLPNLQVPPNMILTEVLELIDNYLGQFNPPIVDLNVNSGVVTMIGDGETLEFSFPHSLGVMPTSISVDPKTIAASDNYSVTHNINNITVSFSVAPSPDEVLEWYWIAIKS